MNCKYTTQCILLAAKVTQRDGTRIRAVTAAHNREESGIILNGIYGIYFDMRKKQTKRTSKVEPESSFPFV